MSETIKAPLKDLEWLTGHQLDRSGLPTSIVGPVNKPELTSLRNSNKYRELLSREHMWFCFLSYQGAHNKKALEQRLRGNETIQVNGEDLPFLKIIRHHDGFRVAMMQDRVQLLKQKDPTYFTNPFAYRVLQPVLDLLEFNGYLEGKIARQSRKLFDNRSHEHNTQHAESIILYRALQKIVTKTIGHKNYMNATRILNMTGIQQLSHEVESQTIPKIAHVRSEESVDLENYRTSVYRAIGANLTTRTVANYTIPMVQHPDHAKLWQETIVGELNALYEKETTKARRAVHQRDKLATELKEMQDAQNAAYNAKLGFLQNYRSDAPRFE